MVEYKRGRKLEIFGGMIFLYFLFTENYLKEHSLYESLYIKRLLQLEYKND